MELHKRHHLVSNCLKILQNTIGCSKRILYLFSFLLFLLPLSKTFAQDDISITATYNHTVTESVLYTSTNLTISPSKTTVITFYTATIPLPNLKVDCYETKTNTKLTCTTYANGNNTDVLINLGQAVLSAGDSTEVRLQYWKEIDSTSDTLTIDSNILDSTIKEINISYPKSKGRPLWMSEKETSIKLMGDDYKITFTNPNFNTLYITYGEKIAYTFQVNRVFANADEQNTQTFELLLPPDTQTQKIIWESIEPLPDTAIMDDDGNYIFKYIVPGGQTINCKLKGYIFMNTSIEEDTEEQNNFLTNQTGYWKITSLEEHSKVVEFMKSRGMDITYEFSDVATLNDAQQQLFYRYLYQYVINRLSIKENTSLVIGTYRRHGAEEITKNTNNSTQEDYADFYMALLRKYNIPCREILGFVSNISGFTSDGFYHYWIEYYDYYQKKWITADPFLEEYLHHSFYGNNLYDHITVLKRGKSPTSPTMTFYEDNDFTVTFNSSPNIEPDFDVQASLLIDQYDITNKYTKAYVYILNKGNTIITNYNFSDSSFGNFKQFLDITENKLSRIIIPKQTITVQANIPYESISTDNVYIDLTFNNKQNQSKEITVKETLQENVPFIMTVLSKVLSLTFFAIILMLLYLLTKIKFKKPMKKKR
ncbi:transglutaminase domain-containing protein [bacterium]|nr:transglutaminase domain-containing protein [bacterium]